MKNKKVLRYAVASMALTILSVCLLYFIYKHNKVGRDYAMMIELGILVACISYNFSKFNDYLERYADVKAFYNVLSFVCICVTIYIYYQNKELFYFISGITFSSLANTIALWIRYIRKEIY